MDIEELRKIAEAATPGSWEWYTSCSYTRLGTSDGYKVLMFATKYKDGVCGIEFAHKPDADFIAAANPSAILGLLETIESLQRERDALREALRDIENPIVFLQREADTNCDKLDGMMAVILSKDAEFLRSIATKALQEVQPNER